MKSFIEKVILLIKIRRKLVNNASSNNKKCIFLYLYYILKGKIIY
jgi:hypothetical protein